jgi:periplasmic glucans biosynthesis protein
MPTFLRPSFQLRQPAFLAHWLTLPALPDGAPVQAIASASASANANANANANGRVTESLAYKNPATGTWRMTLRVQRLNLALLV